MRRDRADEHLGGISSGAAWQLLCLPLFVVFALFLPWGSSSAVQISLLPLVSLLSSVGSPTSSVDAVSSFLSQWLLRLPKQNRPLCM